MNPDLYDGYRTAGQRLGSVADWYIDQLADHGLIVVVAVQAAAFIALWCGIGAVIHAVRRHRARRGIRRLQQYANHPGSRAVLDDFHQPRKETP